MFPTYLSLLNSVPDLYLLVQVVPDLHLLETWCPWPVLFIASCYGVYLTCIFLLQGVLELSLLLEGVPDLRLFFKGVPDLYLIAPDLYLLVTGRYWLVSPVRGCPWPAPPWNTVPRTCIFLLVVIGCTWPVTGCPWHCASFLQGVPDLWVLHAFGSLPSGRADLCSQHCQL